MLFLLVEGGTTFTQDQRLFQAFDSDGNLATHHVLYNVQHGNISPRGFYNYGYVMHSLALLVVVAQQLVGVPVGYADVAFALVLVSAVAFCLSVCGIAWMIGVIMQNLMGISRVQVGLIGMGLSVLLCFSPQYFHWGWHIHPDILQVLWLSVAMVMLRRRQYIGSGLLLGVAFGTKYSALLVVPFWFFWLALISLREKGSWQRTQTFLKRVCVLVLCFFTGWLFTNHSVLLHLDEFTADFLFEAAHVAYGHGFKAPTDGLLWFNIITDELGYMPYLAMLLFPFYLPRCYAAARAWVQDGEEELPVAQIAAMLAYATLMVGIAYMMLFVHYRPARYLFQFYPFLAVVMAYVLPALIHTLPERMKWVVIGALLSTASYMVVLRVSAMHETVELARNSERLAAGKAMLQLISTDKKVVGGYYSYVPDAFKSYQHSWRITDELVEGADILVLNAHIPGRWVWPVYAITPGVTPELLVGQHDGAEQVATLLEPVFKQNGWRLIYQSIPVDDVSGYKNMYQADSDAPEVMIFERLR